jgi:hypothetical protein
MIRKRFFLGSLTTLRTSLSLLAVLLAACAPAPTSTTPPDAATQPPTIFVPTVTLETATQPAPSEATVFPIATSRGPELEATDPTTVSLASGGVQFVEFFRFT